ncbi:hypothetical protein D7V97_18315 [Corallococcus sp. CA053C]|uniref:hypothetical protein n=1 Tax=Corallococcus sp. CA053C TaxID=2316732 RepID=UPI000EA2A3FB|nr:hypothetical protein [Corallococcus sp. CA053C]RKH08821.1 hypothetical protein D7V97_18315 [Corallococcus sp. CA053C]
MSKVNAKTPWHRIRESLDDYAPDKLAAVLRRYLEPRVPPGTRSLPDEERKAMGKQVARLLEENLPPWYSESGVLLGNESLGAYCWCHSFFNQRPTPTMNVNDNIQLMLNALEQSRAWLFKLDAAYQTIERELPSEPGDDDIRVLALADALVQVLDITIQHTGCNETWYTFADQALAWLFDALYIRPGYQAGKLMNKLFAFESWHAPPLEELRDSAEKVATAVVEDEGRRAHRKH